MTGHPRSIGVLGALLVLSVPSVALACPVCGLAGGGDTQGTYAAMSVMLSVIPLGMFAGGTFWLYRRVRRHESEPSPHAEPVAPAAVGAAGPLSAPTVPPRSR